jgi:predicted secreted Zn-dependent protease
VSYTWGLLVCVAMLACGGTSASATMRIVDDRGGQVGKYLQAFAEVRSTGERVIIDGDCLSACTLVLGLVPSSQICATPRARFGFHVPLILNNEGLLVTRAKATQAMWNVYPASVQHWITQHGGLSRQMIYMEGHSLNGIVATCDPSTLRALLVAGASGYSGTLVPRTSPHQPADRPFSAR